MTIVEITVASLILSLLFGLAFQMYHRSNTMAAKGVWRVQATNSIRTALRLTQTCVGGSSYPTMTGSSLLEEITDNDSYKLRVATSQAASSTAGTGSTTFDFKGKGAEYVVMEVHAFQTIKQPATEAGYSRFVFRMGPRGGVAMAPDDAELRIEEERGTYAITGTAAPYTVTLTPVAASTRRTVVRDVDVFRIVLPDDDTATRALVGFEIVCRDSVDGRMTQSTANRVERNVAVFRF